MPVAVHNAALEVRGDAESRLAARRGGGARPRDGTVDRSALGLRTRLVEHLLQRGRRPAQIAAELKVGAVDGQLAPAASRRRPGQG